MFTIFQDNDVIDAARKQCSDQSGMHVLGVLLQTVQLLPVLFSFSSDVLSFSTLGTEALAYDKLGLSDMCTIGSV